MARKPKTTDPTDEKAKLIEALHFVSLALKDSDDKHKFAVMADNWITVTNDVYSIGIASPMAGLNICPQLETLRAALEQCGQTFQTTQVNLGALSIKSGKFRALVATLLMDDVAIVKPDPPLGIISDAIKEGFAASMRIITKGEKVYHKSVLLNPNTIVATNGAIAIEYWHGIPLPKTFSIPKESVKLIAEIGKVLTQFGFSDRTATFYFNDGSFVQTLLMSETWPDVGRLFAAAPTRQHAVWPSFYAAMDAIEAFIVDDIVHFHSGFLATHNSLEIGASYAVDSLPPGYAFSARFLKAIRPFCEHVALPSSPDAPMLFTGQRCRGLLTGRRV
jgi:hypothetical protein